MSIKLRNGPQSRIDAATTIGLPTNPSKITKSNNAVYQRLHPDWRMIPHLDIFGWTGKHQLLEQYLRAQIQNGNICDIYFASEEEYADAEFRQRNSANKFAGRPVVNTVDGIVTILQKYEAEISSPPYTKDNIVGR